MTESEAERLARIETKLDIVVSGHQAKLDDHEARVRLLEERPTNGDYEKLRTDVDGLLKLKWTLVGSIVGTGAISSAATAAISKAIGG